MAAIYLQDLPWHKGETEVRHAMHAPDHDNPTVPALSPQLANHMQVAPLIAIGTLDKQGWPWTTLWGNGDKGFAQPMGQGIIGIRTPVTGKHDPVVEELVGKEATGEVVREGEKGRMVSGLTLDLETRKRTKLYGRMIAGALGMRGDEVTDNEEHVAEVQLVLKIEQSLGNCPKYLNKKHIVAAMAKPVLVSDSPQLSQRALDLVEKADLFFMSSSQLDLDMDTNHRGGPPGFVRVLSNDESGAVLAYPEYSGNRLYQTLGNLAVNPKAGLCFPDFETGDMLYITGMTEILVAKDAAALLPRSNLAVKIKITSARFVSNALPFRGVLGDRSPYNPTIRYLTTEKPLAMAESDAPLSANLLTQTKLTPSISRFRFALEGPAKYTPGQYVTLDLFKNLDTGYSHMANDDPLRINDDFVRTFTVSSIPSTAAQSGGTEQRLKENEFEITIRKVGRVTDYLFQHLGKDSRERGIRDLETGVKGFGGEFEVLQGEGEAITYVAAGVGITPILPSLHSLDISKLKLLWSVKERDLALVEDVLAQQPNLPHSLTLFVSDAKESATTMEELEKKGVTIQKRRMEKQDVEGVIQKIYLCTPVPMRKQLMEWLPGKELVFEDFDF